MPMYTVYCKECDIKTVRICKIAERDEQMCEKCFNIMERRMDRPGAVYAPTSTGGGLKV